MADIRLEQKERLVGWTVMDLIAGKVKEPPLTLKDARTLDARDIFKIDWKTGKFKQREVKGGVIRPTSVRATQKAPEPKPWLDFEGVSPAGEVGATKEFPGVFHIIDKGVVEYGAQKPWFHEYFMSGNKLKGRLAFRLIGRQTESEEMIESVELPPLLDDHTPRNFDEIFEEYEFFGAELDEEDMQQVLNIREAVLPPGVPEERERTPFFWIAMQPLDQTPYVLSSDAVKKKWMPPKGISALPKTVRTEIPVNLRYWNHSGTKARGMRDTLVESDILKFERLGEASPAFVLQRRWWKGPVQVRFGPSTQLWDFRLRKDGQYLNIALKDNPIQNKEIVGAEVSIKNSGKAFDLGKDGPELIEPNTELNPTKDTPAFIDMLDSGDVNILEDSADFKKLELKGKKLKGLWAFKREDPKSDLWLMTVSELPKSTKESVKGFPMHLKHNGKEYVVKTTRSGGLVMNRD